MIQPREEFFLTATHESAFEFRSALADRLGVAASYVHAAGRIESVTPDVRVKLVEAMGWPAATEDAARASLATLDRREWARTLPPVVVAWADAAIDVAVTLDDDEAGPLTAILDAEDGTKESWPVEVDRLAVAARFSLDGRGRTRRIMTLPDKPRPGYHRLRLDGVSGGPVETTLIVAPPRCWLPPAIERGDRLWGLAIQLYGWRSPDNWGHGDFSDLKRVIDQAERLGAGFVGVNPLHALFPERPDRRSPYSPVSRARLQYLYIDIADIPEMAEDGEAQAMVDDPETTAELDALRAADHVDYEAVAALKQPVLERLYATFRRRHLDVDDDRGRAYRRFVAEGGEDLRRFAVFEALREVLSWGEDEHWRPWQHWPAEYHDPDGPAVEAFAAEHAPRIGYHLWLQFEADRQLGLAGRLARERLPLGLYRDLAVGFDRDGAECWRSRDAVPDGISAGCPPDLRNPLGQDWGVATFSPNALREAAYAPFVRVLRENMRHAGVLRIDHAFQLTRLYWVPLGDGPKGGGYVHYPFEDLLAIITLESRRNACAVVAEDLGTIPAGFRERMIEAGALSFRILHRERRPDRSYAPPDSYPALSVAALGTHDQATLPGWWDGLDVATRKRLDLYPSAEAAEQATRDRVMDRALLMEALEYYVGMKSAPSTADGRASEALKLSAYRFLARTPARMLVVHPDDLFGPPAQANMPATVDEHPNWMRRYTRDVEDLATAPLMVDLAEMLAGEGRSARKHGDR